jgi:hypothetical protein
MFWMDLQLPFSGHGRVLRDTGTRALTEPIGVRNICLFKGSFSKGKVTGSEPVGGSGKSGERVSKVGPGGQWHFQGQSEKE